MFRYVGRVYRLKGSWVASWGEDAGQVRSDSYFTVSASSLGTFWGHLRLSRVRFGGHLGATWDHLGATWGHLGATWGHLGPSGAIWGHIERSWNHLRPYGNDLESTLGRLGAILVPPWAPPGLILGPLGALLEALGAFLEHPGRLLGPS